MIARRSAGKRHIGRALWYAAKGRIELRAEPLPLPAPGEALVRTHFSGISRGTEKLVFSGEVPQSEYERMRAPRQEGSFPFPVKYGYCAAGIIEHGPEPMIGRAVFCLAPHQDVFLAPLEMLAPVPEAVPLKRATLAANMETALNAHWDAGTGPGDTIVVVGGGVLGLLIAFLAARLPGSRVTLVDVDAARRPLVEALGASFAEPVATPQDADVVFHASATSAGLATALAAAGMEATVAEVSWFGDKPVTIPLGAAFHSRRLRLVSTQVGQVAPSRRPRWPYGRRLATALTLLDAPVLDALVAEEIAFEEAPEKLPGILAGPSGLAPVIRY